MTHNCPSVTESVPKLITGSTLLARGICYTQVNILLRLQCLKIGKIIRMHTRSFISITLQNAIIFDIMFASNFYREKMVSLDCSHTMLTLVLKHNSYKKIICCSHTGFPSNLKIEHFLNQNGLCKLKEELPLIYVEKFFCVPRSKK